MIASAMGRLAAPFLLAAALAAATLLAGVALLAVSGWFLTAAALAGAGATFNLFGPSALVRGLSLLRIAARYGERLVGHDATLRLLGALRERLFRQVVPRAPLAGLGRRHGDLVSRFTGDVEALDGLFLGALGPALATAAVGLCTTALLAWSMPAGAPLFAAGFLVAALVLPAILLAATRRDGPALVAGAATLRADVLDAVEGRADLLAFGAMPRAGAAFTRAAAAQSGAGRRRALKTALAVGAAQAVGGGTVLGLAWVGLGALQAGTITGPGLVGVLLGALAAFEGVAGLVRGAGRLAAARDAARRLAQVAASGSALPDPVRPASAPAALSLAFRDVRFRRRPERALLDGVSLALAPGERVAVVGPSGAGKSTLLDLALRLHDPAAGRVTLGGVDLRALAAADLHGRVALLAQEAPVFLGTVRENLLIGRADADDAALRGALTAARLDGLVAGLPGGLDAWLGEGGRTLSAGQARRLCLARVLASRADILLLDEPTRGLDGEAERAFLADLAAATRGRTVLLVTHAALPPGCVDRTLRLANGRLRPEG